LIGDAAAKWPRFSRKRALNDHNNNHMPFNSVFLVQAVTLL